MSEIELFKLFDLGKWCKKMISFQSSFGSFINSNVVLAQIPTSVVQKLTRWQQVLSATSNICEPGNQRVCEMVVGK